jgi:hypothetical protein
MPGQYGPNSADVAFAFDLALEAARSLHRLAGRVGDHQTGRAQLAVPAREDWLGGKRDEFDAKAAAEGTDAATVAAALVALAESFASQWALCRGEQDRINFARYKEYDMAQDNALENMWESVAGETDYGPPPSNPPIPTGPDYEPTREPMHSDFGP